MRPSAATRSRSRWLITAMSPGCEPPDQVLGAAVDLRRARPPRTAIVEPALAQPQARAISRRPAATAPAGGAARSRAARPRGGAACDESPTPASMRDSSATRSSPSTTVACATVRSRRRCPALLLFHGLLHHDLRVGERGDLREVRDAEHLVPRAPSACSSVRPRRRPRRRSRRRPRRTPASAAPPRARRAAPASHGRARRRTRPWPAAGRARPGSAASRNVTWSAPSSVGAPGLDLDLEVASGIASSRRCSLTAAAERRGRGSAGAARASAAAAVASRSWAARRPSSAAARAS